MNSKNNTCRLDCGGTTPLWLNDGQFIGDGKTRRVGKAESCLRSPNADRVLRWMVLLLFLCITPGAWTQYPYVPSGSVVGPTVGDSVRNAANATLVQAAQTRKLADDWGRRGASVGYRADYFQNDFNNLHLQFQALQSQFNALAGAAAQSGRPRAANAAAELGAGLNIIAELFPFLQGQFNAGTLDNRTLARTCQAFEDSIREWEREFRRNSSRMGVIY